MPINVTTLYNQIMKLYCQTPYYLGAGGSLPPLQYFVYLTKRCNLRCSFCFFIRGHQDADNSELQAKEMSTAEIQRLVKQLPRPGIITFTGGEPFLRKDIIDIIRYSAHYRTTHLISNGTLIRDCQLPQLIKVGSKSLFGKGLVLFGISVPGLAKTHEKQTGVPGAYDHTIGILKQLVAVKRKSGKKYPMLNFKTVITNDTINELTELYSIAEDIGVDIFNVLAEYALPASKDSPGKSIEQFDQRTDVTQQLDLGRLDTVFRELKSMSLHSSVRLRITPSQVPLSYLFSHYSGMVNLADYYCHSPWSKVEISPYGDVFPCLEFNVGNIRETPFMKIWNGERFKAYRRQLKQKGLFQACLGCCNMELRPWHVKSRDMSH